MAVSASAGSSLLICESIDVFLGVHRKLVREGENGRYLIDVGDRRDGFIQNSDDHMCAARRQEEIQG